MLFVSKTSRRGLQDMSSRGPQDMSSRRLQDMPSKRLQDMFSSHLEEFFSITTFHLARRLARCLQDVFKTSWNTKNCYVEDLLKMPSRRLEDRQMFAGLILKTFCFI